MAQSRKQRRFTEQGIERLRYDPALAPASGRIELEDEVCPGLLLRITPRGTKSFSVIYKVPGEGGLSPRGRLLVDKQHRITLGSAQFLELKEARRLAREIVQAATEGRDPRDERREKNLIRTTNTFSAAFQRFMDIEIKPNVESWRNVERALQIHVEPKWGSRPVQDIRRTDVHGLIDELVADGRKGTAREVRKHLSRFFNWSIDREIIKDSPINGLKRSDLEPNVEAGRALTDCELRCIWQAAGTLGYPFGPMYRLLMLTGQRRNEWAAASRSELDLVQRNLEIPRKRYKGDRDHIVPLSEEALAIIELLPEWAGNDYFLLSSRAGRVPVSGFSQGKRRLDEAAKSLMDGASQFCEYRVHDFRVTCETRLVTLGFNQDVRDAVLGHAKPGLQKTYNKHSYIEEKKAALSAYATHLMRVVS